MAVTLLVSHHFLHGGVLQHALAFQVACLRHHDAQAAQVAAPHPCAAHRDAEVHVRVHISIPVAVKRPLTGLGGAAAGAILGGDLLRLADQGGMQRRIDAQRLKERFGDGIVDVLPRHAFHQRTHHACAKVGIVILAARHILVPVALALQTGVQDLLQGALGNAVAPVGTQGGGVAHQVAQGDRHIGIVEVLHLVAQIIANAGIQVQQAILHQLHHMDARHQLGHRGQAEIGVLADPFAGFLIGIAVMIFVHDIAILGHIHGGACGFQLLERLGHARIQRAFLCHGAGEKHPPCHKQAEKPFHPDQLLWYA